jgi:hypothetical protein
LHQHRPIQARFVADTRDHRVAQLVLAEAGRRHAKRHVAGKRLQRAEAQRRDRPRDQRGLREPPQK